MKAVVRPVQAGDLPRAAQLCQRTNQFNVTSRRYTESDLAAFLEAPDAKMFLLQSEDRFGSSGDSGLIIFRKTGGVVEVDAFLLSCRIIGRRFDHALFCESLRQLGHLWTFDKIYARFIPTPKNRIVSGLWTDYGFSRISTAQDEGYAAAVAELKVSFPDVIELAENL
jgi:FkbH-like protein